MLADSERTEGTRLNDELQRHGPAIVDIQCLNNGYFPSPHTPYKSGSGLTRSFPGL